MTPTPRRYGALAVAAPLLVAAGLVSGCDGGSSSPPASSAALHRLSVRAVLAERTVTSNSAPGTAITSTSSAAPAPVAAPSDPSDLAWLDPTVTAQLGAVRCQPVPASGAASGPVVAPAEDLTRPLVACSVDGATAYALGPAEVQGSDVSEATAVAPGAGSTSWSVMVELSASGAEAFGRMTRRLVLLPDARNQAALVLDGVVVTAPRIAEAITGGRLQISGGFGSAQAQSLADRIRSSVK
jgi:preprotein translocase subunit SecD